MLRIRWEHFASLLLLLAGTFMTAGAWLSYGIRAAVVDDRAAELGTHAAQLASQVAVERVGYLAGGALVAAAVILWIFAGVRHRLVDAAAPRSAQA